MDKLFVFGIGGTGERVMRSLIMLLAGGMVMRDNEGNECRVIQPVLVDSDEKSRALIKVNNLIEAYNKVRKVFDLDANYVKDELVKNNSMFRVQIEKAILFNISGTDVESLAKMVDAQNMPAPDIKAEFDSIYSKKSQNMRLSWGFVGNPSIGAIVLNQMFETEKFQQLKMQSKDGIFIISSIFGGTGAAGFPLLVNKIRKDFDGKFDGLKVGALSMFPYFSLYDVDDESEVAKGLKSYDVNDKEFSTKTKAALAYYDRYVKALSSMYYLGTSKTDFRSKFPKYKGGEKQDNPASMLELLGAKAVSHFIATAEPMTNEIAHQGFRDFTTYYEYFMDKEPQNGLSYDLASIDPDVEFRAIFVRLQLLRYIWKDCALAWINTSGNQWATSIGLDTGKFKNLMGTYLDDFFTEFDAWKKELNHQYHNGGFTFRFFNDAEAKGSEQNFITQRFYPSIAHVTKESTLGFFNQHNVVKDPEILAKMQSPYNSSIGKGFNSDANRYKYAFYTSLYAIEHIIHDQDKKRCINLNFTKQ